MNTNKTMTTIQKTYQQFRNAGYQAHVALSSAKALVEFLELGNDKVRIIAEPEFESYFDVYGEPEGYTDIHGRHHSAEQEREEIIKSIERNGCYCIVAKYWSEESESWETADSVGMCIYDNPLCPFQNCYVAGLMRSAVEAYRDTAESFAI